MATRKTKSRVTRTTVSKTAGRKTAAGRSPATVEARKKTAVLRKWTAKRKSAGSKTPQKPKAGGRAGVATKSTRKVSPGTRANATGRQHPTKPSAHTKKAGSTLRKASPQHLSAASALTEPVDVSQNQMGEEVMVEVTDVELDTPSGPVELEEVVIAPVASFENIEVKPQTRKVKTK